ncbi:MAG: hypothetical protein ACP5HM_10635 [Anaerolineae bacterium]
MTSLKHWEEQRYARVFDATCRYVERRRAEFGFNIADLEALLDNAYQRQGNDWLGRGEVYHLDQAAEIAAYESILARWRKEKTLLKQG